MAITFPSFSSSNLIGILFSFGFVQFELVWALSPAFQRYDFGGWRQRGVRVKVPRFGEELVLGQMLFIHGQRADDPPGHVRVMGLRPRDELFHFAARARAGAEDEDLAGRLQCLGHRFKKAVRIRFLLASRNILRIARMAENILSHCAAGSRPGWAPGICRTENASLMVIDHEQPIRVVRIRSGRDRLRLFEKVAQCHDVPIFRNILCVRLMQDERLTVARRLEVPIGFFRDLAKLL